MKLCEKLKRNGKKRTGIAVRFLLYVTHVADDISYRDWSGAVLRAISESGT